MELFVEENVQGYGNPRMRDLVLPALILSQIKRTGMVMDQWVVFLVVLLRGAFLTLSFVLFFFFFKKNK